MVAEGKIKRDPRQDAVVTLFQNLGDKLEGGRKSSSIPVQKSSSSSWSNFWSPSTTHTSPQPTPSQGLYIHGGCGTGKTMLMDLFFSNLDYSKKKRVHFHEYMIDVHNRLHLLQKKNASLQKCDTQWTASSAEKQRLFLSQKSSQESPGGDLCERVADELIREAEFLCFDEFQVTFISDAVIMRRLFSYLFDKGVVVVATSNRPPDDLYMNGLNRELFLPFIPLLKQRCIVHNMDSRVDYRQLTTAPHNQVFFPHGNDRLESKFFRLARNDIDMNNLGIEVQGRTVAIRRAAKNSSIAWFTFQELCDKPLGSADYISIAKKFHTVFIENIPKLTIGERDQVRRFITLIDALYDNHVRLVCSSEAADNVSEIFSVDEVTKKNSSMDEIFAWDRTVSRLTEMLSEEYQIKHCRNLSVDQFYGQFDLNAKNFSSDDLQDIFVRYDKNNDKVIALAGLNRMLNEINMVRTHHHPDKILTANSKLRLALSGSESGKRIFYDKFENFVNGNGGLVSALLANSDMQ